MKRRIFAKGNVVDGGNVDFGSSDNRSEPDKVLPQPTLEEIKAQYEQLQADYKKLEKAKQAAEETEEFLQNRNLALMMENNLLQTRINTLEINALPPLNMTGAGGLGNIKITPPTIKGSHGNSYVNTVSPAFTQEVTNKDLDFIKIPPFEEDMPKKPTLEELISFKYEKEKEYKPLIMQHNIHHTSGRKDYHNPIKIIGDENDYSQVIRDLIADPNKILSKIKYSDKEKNG